MANNTNHNPDVVRVVQAIRRDAIRASRHGDHETARSRIRDLAWYAEQRCLTGFERGES